MKRVKIDKIIEPSLDQILPPELWPGILRYLSLWHRMRYVTVCKAWSNPKGYIDQSIERLRGKDPKPIDLTRLVNLTNLSTIYLPLIDGLIRYNHLIKLQRLKIEFAGFESPDMEIISLLVNLRSFEVNFQNAYTTDKLPYLNSLTTLKLVAGKSRRVNIVDSFLLASAETLTNLTLEGIVTKENTFISMTRLECLNLYRHLLDEPKSSIGSLTTLRSLSLRGNSKMCEIGMLSRLTNLTCLGLKSNPIIRDEDITHLTSLVSLNLTDNGLITERVLSSFPLLTQLILFDSSLGKGGLLKSRQPRERHPLFQLKALSFSGLSDHTHFLNAYLPCLTGLTELHVHHNRFVDFSNLSCLTNLERLQISTFQSIGLNDLPLSLRKLEVSSCDRYHEIINPISTRLTNLTDLMLGQMPITLSELLSIHWSNITCLQKLECIAYRDQKPANLSTLERLPRQVELIHY